MNTAKAQEIIASLQNDITEGLISADVWELNNHSILASHNSNYNASILIDQILVNLQESLEFSKLNAIQDYMFFNLENHTQLVVVKIQDMVCAMVIDTRKVPLGLLLNIVIPNVLK